jgi:hypothetical protein
MINVTFLQELMEKLGHKAERDPLDQKGHKEKKVYRDLPAKLEKRDRKVKLFS